MASRMRSNFAQDTSKTYYLTAAPQCPFPDVSMPLDVCSQMDYVWVQFYNNGNCDIGQPGFLGAVTSWSQGIGDAKLFVGGLGAPVQGNTGYVDSFIFRGVLSQVKALGLANYGGAMLWEAQMSAMNGNYQQEIAAAL